MWNTVVHFTKVRIDTIKLVAMKLNDMMSLKMIEATGLRICHVNPKLIM